MLILGIPFKPFKRFIIWETHVYISNALVSFQVNWRGLNISRWNVTWLQ